VRQQDAYLANVGVGGCSYSYVQHCTPFSRMTSVSLIVCFYQA